MKKTILAVLCWCFMMNGVVVGSEVIDRVATRENVICLTLENLQSTAEMEKALKVCEENRAQVTFFLTGNFIKNNMGIVKKAVEQGHEIGNFGMDGKYYGDIQMEAIRKDLQQAQGVLNEFTEKNAVRPPYQYYFDPFFQSVDQEIPNTVIVRGIEALDWTLPTAEAAITKLKSTWQPGDVINIDMANPKGMVLLQKLLQELKKSDYRTVPFMQLYTSANSNSAVQIPCKVYYRGDNGKPNIALTFDDGGSYEKAQEILDVLKYYHVRSTFFLLGEWIDANPDLVKRMLAEGHEIANHTYSHPRSTRLTYDQMASEVQRTGQAVMNIAGKPIMPLFRPPYGDYNDSVLIVLNDIGYIGMILWDVDTLDWSGRDADDIVQSVLSGAKSGSIVLFHLHGRHTAQALQELIPILQDRGYQLTTVTDLMKIY